MRRLSISLLLLACAAAPTFSAEEPEKLGVLLITGDDVSPAHDWLGCAQATRQVLREAGNFEVSSIGNPAILERRSHLENIDVIYFAMYNARTPTLSDLAKENLLEFVRSGKGLVVSHLGSASFPEWDEFKKLCGRAWVMGVSGHGPRSVFEAKIVDPNHPITRGLTDFQQDDELYAKLQGDTPVHVLLEAYSDWSEANEPLAFVLPYGDGRVFHHTLGHDPKAINNPSVKTLIIQGTAWAAEADNTPTP